mgnify:CR=1 FL=1
MTYKPLPKKLYIKNSSIHGQGLFTDKKLKTGVVLGLSHIKLANGNFDNNLIRTPLGGFLNHSEEPNCELIESQVAYYLTVIKNIKPGEESPVKSQWYEV